MNPKKPKPTVKGLDVLGTASPHSDPQGSYTGLPVEPNSIPVQDADDL